MRSRGREPEHHARMSAPPRPRPSALAAPGEAAEEATPAAAGLPLLDLMELALDRVLEELSPASLAAPPRMRPSALPPLPLLRRIRSITLP